MGNKCLKCKHVMLVQDGDEDSPYEMRCKAIGPDYSQDEEGMTTVKYPDCDVIRQGDEDCWLYKRDGGFLGWFWDLILDLPWIFK